MPHDDEDEADFTLSDKLNLPSSPTAAPPQLSSHNSELFNNIKTKEDYMNLSIEMIWKEMEELNRSKLAAQNLFQEFQDNFYDREVKSP